MWRRERRKEIDMIDAFKTNGSSPPVVQTKRVPTMSDGVLEAYGRGRDRQWRWSARVKVNGDSVQYRRRGFDTRELALADRDRILAEVRSPGSTNTTSVETITLSAALDRLLIEKARKKTIAEYGRIAERLKRAFGADTPLPALTAAKISAWRAAKMSALSERTGRQLSPASINRPLAVLRHLLKVAHEEWGLLADVPRVRLEKESQGRLRWLTKEEASRLLAAAAKSKNADLHDLVVVALYTGLRQSELLGLTWERVDRSRGVIRLEITKSGKRREVPFGRAVDDVFARRQRAAGTVFPRSKWNSYRTAFETTVRVAGLDDFHWHDLRHTYASWLVQAGRPLVEVKDLLGHATLAMTMRYAHLAPEHLRQAVAVLDEIQLVPPPAPAQGAPDLRRVQSGGR
jgi:integrase